MLKFSSILALLTLINFSPSQAAIPSMVNYQGVFVDTAGKGEAINDTLEFLFFGAPSGGTALWSESHYVQSANGVFSVVLGSKTTIQSAVINQNDSIFLEVKKGGTVSGNRTKITGVFYALRAAISDSAGLSGFADSARASGRPALADSAAVSGVSDSAHAAGQADTARSAGQATTATFADSARAAGQASTATFADSARAGGTRFWNTSGTGIDCSVSSVGIGYPPDPIHNLTIGGPLSMAGTLRFRGADADTYAEIGYGFGFMQIGFFDISGVVYPLSIAKNGTVLTAAGEIKAQGFNVGGTVLNVPDFVFGDDYKLTPLSEVENFVKKNKHLRNIPSEKEIKEHGLKLEEMNMKLLEKVEELTLYLIDQEKRIKKLESKTKL